MGRPSLRRFMALAPLTGVECHSAHSGLKHIKMNMWDFALLSSKPSLRLRENDSWHCLSCFLLVVVADELTGMLRIRL